jgi:hypothetical protein
VSRDTCNKICFPYYPGQAICVFKLVSNVIEKQRKTIHNEYVKREIKVNYFYYIQVSFLFIFHLLILVSVVYYSSLSIHPSLFSVIVGSNSIRIVTSDIRANLPWTWNMASDTRTIKITKA